MWPPTSCEARPPGGITARKGSSASETVASPMQRRRVKGPPEAVFARLQDRLGELHAAVHLVDPASITLLFDLELPGKGPPFTFFLAVVPSDDAHSDVALARKRKGRREDFRAMVVGEDDPIERDVLAFLCGEKA